jgi:MoxR-like ATPase
VLSGQDVLSAQALTREVGISDDLLDYVTRLVRATRPETSSSSYVKEWTRWGAGPRAGQALVLAAKARAVVSGRLAVTLADLRAVAYPVLRHRILVNFRAEAEGVRADDVTTKLLAEVAEPRSPLA